MEREVVAGAGIPHCGPSSDLIQTPTRIEAAGNKPKLIEEFIGLVNTGTRALSIARMRSPKGWKEPGQIPEFDEYFDTALPSKEAPIISPSACPRLVPRLFTGTNNQIQ